MPNYKLTYFDIDGGRAEFIRIALHSAGIKFTDDRISFEEFAKMRSSTRFNAVPVMQIEDQQITQTNSIARYIGKLSGLYPSDDLQALYCDETMSAVEDLSHQVVKTFGLEGETLKSAREELASGWMTTILRGLEGLLVRGGGTYFADRQLTLADLKVFVQMRSLSSGMLDHIPKDIVDNVAPGLAKHRDRMADEAIVSSYYSERQQSG